ncbi:MAG TPA: sialidase family protein [Verrucomicrobiae bacterium]|nr:sialidase family protein [Verrucomicrobiae bacterium]
MIVSTGFAVFGETNSVPIINWQAPIHVSTGGWGRMIRLTDGSWLSVATQFPHGTNSFLKLFRSRDDCRSWKPVTTVTEAGRIFDNGELVQLPDGDVLLTGRSLIEGKSYKLPVYRSMDFGATWHYLSNIDTSEGLGRRGLWEPDFWVLADGRLVVTYSNEKHDGFSQLISERVSTNNGATWGEEIRAVAEPGGGNLRPGMSQMARMTNGKYILVYELINVGHGDVHQKISDDGITWPVGIGMPIPGQHCGPFVAALPDGRVAVSSCENELSLSGDFGASWQMVMPTPWRLGFKFTWPAIYVVKTNEIGVMISNGGVRLRLGELPVAVR